MDPIRSILIVGGGTAGWLAAAFLQRALGRHPQHPVRITLVEAPEIPTIGVGEATVPTLRNTLRTIGIPEPALFARCEATLKNGIRFVGWREGGGPQADRFDHPFDPPMALEGYSTMVHWLNLKQRGLAPAPLADSVSPQQALFDEARSPKLMQSPNYEAPVPYAYHLDATLLAALLRETAVSRGVHHVTGQVVQVQAGPAGIGGLRLADGRALEADFYIDCTGFASLLLGRALEVPWQSFADQLLCDRAVACPVVHDDGDAPALRSYTTATAQAAGWTWEIDLQHRRGTGYVYASSHCSDDEALATLARWHGGRRRLAEPRLLRMQIGRRARAWDRNCLALGLAGGFIEPLESTGIYLIEHALQLFIDHLPRGRGVDDAPATRAAFNRMMADQYDELRDFIVLHYVLSRRRDTPFWRDATAPERVGASLGELLALWDEKIPHTTDLNRRHSLFGPNNWFFILAGMHRLPSQGIAQAATIPVETSRAVLAQVAGIRDAARTQSPSMRDFAQKQRAASAALSGQMLATAT